MHSINTAKDVSSINTESIFQLSELHAVHHDLIDYHP